MNAKIKVLIADDHQIVRMGLATILRPARDMAVVGEAKNGIEAVRLARELTPDVVLMDLMMPKKDGVAATEEIVRDNAAVRVLVLTTFGESDGVARALEAGATGALVKDTPHEELLDAIRRTAAGERTVSPDIEQSLRDTAPEIELSDRQREILNYVAKGLTTKDISNLVGIGPNGVNAHLRTIFLRLGAASRAEAVAIALRKRLLKA